MNRLILTIAFLAATTSLWAQQSNVSGSLIDASTNEGIIGAVVEIAPLNSTEDIRYDASAFDGSFKFNAVKYGKYTIKASYIGYEDSVDTINVETLSLALSPIKLTESSSQIDAVVKEIQAMRASQQGDTISYNAAAFKVAADADVEGLLKKMPGITVASDGEVTAQGETIQRIYIDGREFFGGDVTTAINSLPADMVQSIEVYDKLSDNAELSGMDDGNGYKSINIVTKSNMRQGFFGKMYAGYGYQPEVHNGIDHNKYTAGANINFFKDKHRFSLITMLNNINKQNFSFDDIVDASGGGSGGSDYLVRPQAGVAKVGAIGLNYSGTLDKKENVKVTASYFYNNTKTTNIQSVDRWYEAPMRIDTLQTIRDSYTPNSNHRFNARLEWKITPSQQITLRQSGSVQANNAQSTTLGAQWGESGYKITDSYSAGDKNGFNSNTSLSYIVRLGKAGRSISANGSFALREISNKSNSYTNSAAKFYPTEERNPINATDTLGWGELYEDELYDILYRSISTPTNSRTISANATYAEPLNENLRFTIKYRYSENLQSTIKNTYYTDADYDTTGLEIDPATSNSRQTEYLTHQVGPGLYYSKGKNKVSLRAAYQLSELIGNAVLNGSTEQQPISSKYENITYSAMGQIYFNATSSLRMQLSSNTNNPWVGYLVDTYDISNKQNISRGNPNLVPSYKQTFKVRYVHSNVEKGSTLMMMAMATNTKNNISQHIVLDPVIEDFDYVPMKYSTYVNLDDYWYTRAQINYGFPISFIKCNFNISGGVNYSLSPSMFGGTVQSDGTITGGKLNLTDNIGYNARAVLGSNISENVDFTLSWDGKYNEATNSAAEVVSKNRYFSHSASATMKFVFGAGFTVSGNATYKQYKGITNDYNDSFLLCGAFIGKKIFHNKRGEINLGVNDIFNQNTAFYRSVSSGYTQNTINSVIGRYAVVQFIYNLRSFGSNGSHKRNSTRKARF